MNLEFRFDMDKQGDDYIIKLCETHSPPMFRRGQGW